MKITNGSRLAALAAMGLALALAGCSGSSDTCKKTSDCPTGQVCTSAGTCSADKCASVTCPGHQTCDASTGACTGTCCQAGDCTDPRTECDQQACAAGQTACVQKQCSPACQTGFVCNQTTSPASCEAACLTQGCPNANEVCNAQTGSCDVRPPVAGEVGSNCASTADCNPTGGSNFTCFTSVPGGYCSKQCSADTDCPQGAFCGSNGICIDACDSNLGDCLRGQQCLVGAFGSGKPDGCFPQFDQSDCTGAACLPNGSPCTNTQQCMKDASCIAYGSGSICQAIQCQLFGQGCSASETCEGLGIGLTACFNNCDATDPSACSGLADQYGSLDCVANPQIAGPSDGYSLAASAGDCPAGTTAKSFTVQGQTAAVCYQGCTADSDCGPGQFCGDNAVTLSDGTTAASFKTCMNYNVATAACSTNPCGNQTGCQDLTVSGQTAAVCFDACTSDADCTAGFGGSCQRLSFLTGDSINLCLYQTAGSFCFAGCSNNADCGYCTTDADCGTVKGQDQTSRSQKCDIPSHMCVTPINGVAEVGNWCRSNQAYDATAITDASGGTSGGCATTCKDDLDCAGTCVKASGAATGFCALKTQMCNGPTGQCEDACSGAASGATDCIHGDCAAANGPNGEDRCVLGCTAPTDNCAAGECDTGSQFCVDKPKFTSLSIGGKDALGADVVTVAAGTETVAWATQHATGIGLFTAPVPSSGGCAAVTTWPTELSVPGDQPSGTFDVTVSGNLCYLASASGLVSEYDRVFEVDQAP